LSCRKNVLKCWPFLEALLGVIPEIYWGQTIRMHIKGNVKAKLAGKE
jgi:hypothetical protein